MRYYNQILTWPSKKYLKPLQSKGRWQLAGASSDSIKLVLERDDHSHVSSKKLKIEKEMLLYISFFFLIMTDLCLWWCVKLSFMHKSLVFNFCEHLNEQWVHGMWKQLKTAYGS